MTGFFIGIAILMGMGLVVLYMNSKYGFPHEQADRKQVNQGSHPDLM
jgi:hypothetical protein